MNQLQALKQYTNVVADTGDFLQIAQYQPQDATTNPSLILKAVQKPEYAPLFKETVLNNKGKSIEDITDAVLVKFGCEILKTIPGRVSTEVDARLSFDEDATYTRAEKIIQLYENAGISPERVLIKIAATWEGIQAAKRLQKRGINCNLTLLFSFSQAIACAAANVTLISPFVGRIYDWHKAKAGANWREEDNAGENDAGVKSVKKIFNYYKHFGIKTQIMGASFRNAGQIIALAGCDLLTISPELLKELSENTALITPALDAKKAKEMQITPQNYTQAEFLLEITKDEMASEKLYQGIRAFIQDGEKLDKLIKEV